jgi:hypothetical protein
MSSVDFITFTWKGDVHRLAAPGELKSRIDSHQYDFNKRILVKQRLRDEPDFQWDFSWTTDPVVESEDYPDILSRFSIEPDQPIADEKTHGPTALHYWKWHVINHLIGLVVSEADYIVFSDADCRMESQPMRSWVDKGIELLQQHRDILIVGPSDGGTMAERHIGNVRLTQNVSQQLFICERKRFVDEVDFDVPWNWEFLAPGEPFQEFYYLLEGRLWRFMHHNGLYRAILPEQWRYWHDQW